MATDEETKEPRMARTPVAPARAELREKGSRFLALVEPVRDAASARARIEALAREHRDATHVCWAWRLLEPPSERCSDAGEPMGTAGPPILRALAAEGLSDVLGVVVRWYGGTKLGKGGLARAYAAATRAALAATTVAERRPSLRLEVQVRYEGVGAVQRLVQPPAVSLEASDFGEDATFVLRVWRERLTRLEEALVAMGARWRRL
ncbi:MAG TPA: YigZ family protein [Thermoanaerobaculia bacterium]|nr:YigZ family protein [Thermoanaerobaculia bacterium]